MQKLFSTTVHASGDGRNGHVASDDGFIDHDVRMPPELGGSGGATNPEQLFAAGYAACFHSALRLVASEFDCDTTGSEVSATVHFLTLDNGAFGLGVELDISLPAAAKDEAELAAARAHEVCPYSNATRGNIEVKISVI